MRKCAMWTHIEMSMAKKKVVFSHYRGRWTIIKLLVLHFSCTNWNINNNNKNWNAYWKKSLYLFNIWRENKYLTIKNTNLNLFNLGNSFVQQFIDGLYTCNSWIQILYQMKNWERKIQWLFDLWKFELAKFEQKQKKTHR